MFDQTNLSRDPEAPVSPVKRRIGLRIAFFAAVLASCAIYYFLRNNDLVGQFLYNRAKTLGRSVLDNPAAASPQAIRQTTERFRHVLRFAKGTAWAAQSHESLGHLSMALRRYEEARNWFEPLCTVYDTFGDSCLLSRLFIGHSYEAEDNLKEAIRVYSEMSGLHLWSPLWTEVALYPGQTYDRYGKRENATKAYKKARDFYLRNIGASEIPFIDELLKINLAKAYEGLHEWQNAADVLEKALNSDMDKEMQKRPEMLLQLVSLYAQQLSSPEKAQTYFKELTGAFPKNPLTTQAAEILKPQ